MVFFRDRCAVDLGVSGRQNLRISCTILDRTFCTNSWTHSIHMIQSLAVHSTDVKLRMNIILSTPVIWQLALCDIYRQNEWNYITLTCCSSPSRENVLRCRQKRDINLFASGGPIKLEWQKRHPCMTLPGFNKLCKIAKKKWTHIQICVQLHAS